MNPAAFHDRLDVHGLSIRRFAAITGVTYTTARHWGWRTSWTPAEVSALGSADAGNDGSDGLSEAARSGASPTHDWTPSFRHTGSIANLVMGTEARPTRAPEVVLPAMHIGSA
jgi:hypothetical protein